MGSFQFASGRWAQAGSINMNMVKACIRIEFGYKSWLPADRISNKKIRLLSGAPARFDDHRHQSNGQAPCLRPHTRIPIPEDHGLRLENPTDIFCGAGKKFS